MKGHKLWFFNDPEHQYLRCSGSLPIEKTQVTTFRGIIIFIVLFQYIKLSKINNAMSFDISIVFIHIGCVFIKFYIMQ